jgi:hypothetical protein
LLRRSDRKTGYHSIKNVKSTYGLAIFQKENRSGYSICPKLF